MPRWGMRVWLSAVVGALVLGGCSATFEAPAVEGASTPSRSPSPGPTITGLGELRPVPGPSSGVRFLEGGRPIDWSEWPDPCALLSEQTLRKVLGTVPSPRRSDLFDHKRDCRWHHGPDVVSGGGPALLPLSELHLEIEPDPPQQDVCERAVPVTLDQAYEAPGLGTCAYVADALAGADLGFVREGGKIDVSVVATTSSASSRDFFPLILDLGHEIDDRWDTAARYPS